MTEPSLNPVEPIDVAPIEVELIADLACPWCYLGLVRLDRARAARPQLPVRLRWRPFLLNPHLPPEGMDRRAYLRAKFGGAAAAQRVYQRIQESGRADGVDFAFDRIRRTPNTVLAQRLLLYAEEHGLGDPMMRALFRALFEEGRDLGDPGELLELGVAVGLHRESLEAFLASDDRADEIVTSHRWAERLGVQGVPVFLVDRSHIIAGAQPPEVLTGLLDLAAQRGRSTAEAEAAPVA
jgi:predicted DsbA family dithiol-disulfide isomerase